MYHCPKCGAELQESFIGINGDKAIPSVECPQCDFYKSVYGFREYIDDDC